MKKASGTALDGPYSCSPRFSAALKDTEKKELAAAMHEMTFSKDETIFEQGVAWIKILSALFLSFGSDWCVNQASS